MFQYLVFLETHIGCPSMLQKSSNCIQLLINPRRERRALYAEVLLPKQNDYILKSPRCEGPGFCWLDPSPHLSSSLHLPRQTLMTCCHLSTSNRFLWARGQQIWKTVSILIKKEHMKEPEKVKISAHVRYLSSDYLLGWNFMKLPCFAGQK